MVAQVVPALPLPRSMGLFDYRVPDHPSISPGQIVRIPFRQRAVRGIVWSLKTQSDVAPNRLRSIESVEAGGPLLTDEDRAFFDWVADRYGVSLSLLVKGLVQRPWPDAPHRASAATRRLRSGKPALPWTPGELHLGIFSRQHDREDFYRRLFAAPANHPLLIIVPEHAGLRTLVPLLPVGSAIVTGEQSIREQRATAERLLSAPVIVGTRSLLLLPFPPVRLLIIDEEENEQHKQRDQQPRITTLTLAQELARRRGLPVVAISAAPTIGAYAVARDQRTFRIGTRPSPVIHLVSRTRTHNGQRDLLHHLEALGKSPERIFLFLNRRGLARLLLCPDCGWLARCAACHTPLAKDARGLRCPTDGRLISVPDRCPQCQNVALTTLLPGTAGLERIIERRWPGSVTRLDRDQPTPPIREKRILIGTEFALPQLAAFQPAHALIVGIDAVFAQPSARAFERTFQLLRRIAATDSLKTVTIETRSPNHSLFQAFARSDVDSFLATEFAARQRFHLPPARRLLAFESAHPTAETLQSLRQWLAQCPLDPGALRGPILLRQGRRSITRYLLPVANDFTFSPNGLTSLPESWIIDPEPQL